MTEVAHRRTHIDLFPTQTASDFRVYEWFEISLIDGKAREPFTFSLSFFDFFI
jgi:hypothetical protein